MKRIIYLPLEPLKERYTLQLSAPKTGWLESRWIEHRVPYLRIEGIPLRDTIKHGSVLDANGRGYWAASQIMQVLKLLDDGMITNDDVIFFDDFWHPGISALRYSFDQMRVFPGMYAFCYAQSVDKFDFTYPMRHWMRHFEIGIGKILDGIFVTSTALRDLLIYAGIGSESTVHVTGLFYNSDEVMSRWPAELPARKKQVVYSSRWDKEKRPEIFMYIMDAVLAMRQDVKFVITTSFSKVHSNVQGLKSMLQSRIKRYPQNIEVRENQTKEEYYKTLLESSIQINTADQDWVSWTLLEATTCGCRPLYPDFLSFPEALHYDYDLMYNKNDVDAAALKINDFIDEPRHISDYGWIYHKYNLSWARALNIMNNCDYEPLYRN